MAWIVSGSPEAVDPHMIVLLKLALFVEVPDLVVPAMIMEFVGCPPISPSDPSMENLVSSMFDTSLLVICEDNFATPIIVVKAVFNAE
jgi:hypothetical protein